MRALGFRTARIEQLPPPRRVNPALARVNSRLAADPREILPAIAARRGETLTALSRMLSRSDGYLARFVREGIPVALSRRDHRFLAQHFGMTERELGIRDLWGD